ACVARVHSRRRRRVGVVLVSMAAALVAALCYGIAAVMQAMAVRAASRRTASAHRSRLGTGDPGLGVRMLRPGPFIASLGLDLIGFLAQLVALRQLLLFAAQAIIASNLAVTAVFAAWLMHLELAWREWLAVVGVILGVSMLGASAGPHVAVGVGRDFKLALIVAVAGIAVAGVAASPLREPARTPGPGGVGGPGYGGLAVAARGLPGVQLHQPIRGGSRAGGGGLVRFRVARPGGGGRRGAGAPGRGGAGGAPPARGGRRDVPRRPHPPRTRRPGGARVQPRHRLRGRPGPVRGGRRTRADGGAAAPRPAGRRGRADPAYGPVAARSAPRPLGAGAGRPGQLPARPPGPAPGPAARATPRIGPRTGRPGRPPGPAAPVGRPGRPLRRLSQPGRWHYRV